MFRCGRVVLTLMLGAAGCAAPGGPELKGQAGPISWEVADIVQSSREGGTLLRWDYSVVLHSTGSRGIYLERMEIGASGRDLYGGMTTERLGRRIEPNETYRLTRWDSYGCPQCPPGKLPQVFSEGMTKILMIDALEDGGDAIRVVIRIPLNSSVGHQSVVGAKGTATGAAPATDVVPSDAWTRAPMWQVGDEWTYRWESPRGSGTLVYEVTSEETVRGIECYVVKSGRSHTYYRKADLAFVQETNSSGLVYTYTPPRQYATWPLYVGRGWELPILQERPQDRTTENIFKTWWVEAQESITVPAGTFETYRIIERNKRDNSMSTEIWLAPDVKARVRTKTHFNYGVETRELMAYKIDQGS